MWVRSEAQPRNYSRQSDVSLEEECKCCQTLVWNPQIALDRRGENTKGGRYDLHDHSLLTLFSPLNI